MKLLLFLLFITLATSCKRGNTHLYEWCLKMRQYGNNECIKIGSFYLGGKYNITIPPYGYMNISNSICKTDNPIILRDYVNMLLGSGAYGNRINFWCDNPLCDKCNNKYDNCYRPAKIIPITNHYCTSIGNWAIMLVKWIDALKELCYEDRINETLNVLGKEQFCKVVHYSKNCSPLCDMHFPQCY